MIFSVENNRPSKLGAQLLHADLRNDLTLRTRMLSSTKLYILTGVILVCGYKKSLNKKKRNIYVKKKREKIEQTKSTYQNIFK